MTDSLGVRLVAYGEAVKKGQNLLQIIRDAGSYGTLVKK
jgi:hypothetical protein